MSHARLTALALAATSLVLAAGGCGGSSKSASTEASTSAASTTTTTAATLPNVPVAIAPGRPLKRAQWIVKGDAIWSRLNTELEAVHVKKVAELVRVLPQEVAYERAAVTQLAKLVPPPSKADDWRQFLGAMLQWAEGSSELAAYAKLGDTITRSPLATATGAVHKQMNQIARYDGLMACSTV